MFFAGTPISYAWDAGSTYVREPPFVAADLGDLAEILAAQPLHDEERHAAELGRDVGVGHGDHVIAVDPGGRAGVHRRRVRGSIGRVTNETVDVVVVGAGAMGSAAAWALASADRDVVVLEQHTLGHDQGGSHGGSRLFRLDYADGETLASALRAERLWRRIEEETGEAPMLALILVRLARPMAMGWSLYLR